jgi:uncharacterized protein YnzC (UPF0291/DUF896 family)
LILGVTYGKEGEGAMTLKQGVINSSQRGLTNGWTRNTFILREDYLEKIRALAYWERKTIKEVVDEALGSYLKGKRIDPTKERTKEKLLENDRRL